MRGLRYLAPGPVLLHELTKFPSFAMRLSLGIHVLDRMNDRSPRNRFDFDRLAGLFDPVQFRRLSHAPAKPHPDFDISFRRWKEWQFRGSVLRGPLRLRSGTVEKSESD